MGVCVWGKAAGTVRGGMGRDIALLGSGRTLSAKSLSETMREMGTTAATTQLRRSWSLSAESLPRRLSTISASSSACLFGVYTGPQCSESLVLLALRTSCCIMLHTLLYLRLLASLISALNEEVASGMTLFVGTSHAGRIREWT